MIATHYETAGPGKLPLTRKEKINRLTALAAPRTAELLRLKGVVGVGVGLPQGSQIPAIKIYVTKDTPELRKLLPQTMTGNSSTS